MTYDLTGHGLLWEAIQQKEDYPIFRLTYLSKPVKPFTDADLNDIESKSVGANNERDVTGLLIALNDRILQILEGRVRCGARALREDRGYRGYGAYDPPHEPHTSDIPAAFVRSDDFGL